VTNQEAEILNAGSVADALPQEARQELGDLTPTSSGNFGERLWKLVSDALQTSGGAVRTALKTACMLLAAVMICSFASAFESGLSQKAAVLAGSLAITAICTSGLHGMIGVAADTIGQIADFTKLLLPVLSSAAAASGALTSAGALYVGSSLFLSVLASAIRALLIPLVYAFAAMSLAESAMEDVRLGGMRRLLGWAIQTVLKGVMYLFTGYLAATGILSGSADAAALKAARAAVSGALPVVGGIASDAAESVMAGAGAIKSSVGVFGMLGLLAIGLAPFLKIALSYLALKITAAVGATAGCSAHTQLLENLSAAMGYMLAMTGSCLLMALVSCCCFIKAVSG
jgi:stage III sporulation protein AE